MADEGGSSTPNVKDKRYAETQAKIKEVVDVMRINVEKVMERDQKLSDLEDRAQAMEHGSAIYQQQSSAIRRKYWWQNLKMKLIIGGIVATLLIIIIVWASAGSGKPSNPVTTTTTTTTTPAPKP